jgi:hypothetical protein
MYAAACTYTHIPGYIHTIHMHTYTHKIYVHTDIRQKDPEDERDKERRLVWTGVPTPVKIMQAALDAVKLTEQDTLLDGMWCLYVLVRYISA